MGMCSNKKRSSPGVVVWCVVLGLALLVVEAAGKELSYCKHQCRGRRGFHYIFCLDSCIRAPNNGAATRLAAYGGAGGEAREGGGRAGHLAEQHGDAAYCSAICHGRSDFGPCYNECLYGRVTGQEEARGGGGVGGQAGLLAMPTEHAGREEEEKGKQEDSIVRLTDPVWCYDVCNAQKVMPVDQCVKECYAENLPDAARLAAHGGTGGEEARGGGGVDALTAAAGILKYSRCRGFVDCSVKPCVWRCMRQAGWESTQHEDEETRGGAVDVPMAAAAAAVQHEAAAAGALSGGNCDDYCRKYYDVGSPAYRHCQYRCPRLTAHGVAEGEEARGDGGVGQEKRE